MDNNFYKNLFKIINNDCNRLKQAYIRTIFDNVSGSDLFMNGRGANAYWNANFTDAILKWCESHEHEGEESLPETFLPEFNDEILGIMSPEALEKRLTERKQLAELNEFEGKKLESVESSI